MNRIKKFDCVKMVRDIRDEFYEKHKDKSIEEMLDIIIDDAKKRIHLLKKGLEGTHEEKDLDVALVRYNTFEKHIDTCKTVEDFSRFKTAILEYIDAESIDIRKQHLNLKEALKASMKTMTELQVVGSKL